MDMEKKELIGIPPDHLGSVTSLTHWTKKGNGSGWKYAGIYSEKSSCR